MSEIIELVNEASSEGIQKEYEYKYILTEQIYKVLNNESFKELSIQSNQKIRFTAKSKKTRPYIYFDTPALDLLNKKAQFSVRKRENDFFITFKKPEYGFENPSLTGRVENNYKLTLTEGEAIFASSSVDKNTRSSREGRNFCRHRWLTYERTLPLHSGYESFFCIH